MLLLDAIKEPDHLLFASCIAAEGRGGAAFRFDGRDKWGELVFGAACHACVKSLACEAPGNRAAECVTGADDEADGFAFHDVVSIPKSRM
jgi:hypothetical protein